MFPSLGSASKYQPGDDDYSCETCVCQKDPYCCNVNWDWICENAANNSAVCADACEEEACPENPSDPEPSAAKMRDEACSDFRWIGRLSPNVATCPAPLPSPAGATSWTASPLFDLSGTKLPLRQLEGYCVYEYVGPPVSPTGLPGVLGQLPTMNGLSSDQWLDKDCLVAVPEADAGIFNWLRDQAPAAFRAAAEAVPQYPFNPSADVTVAVIDNYTKDLEGEGFDPTAPFGSSDHGPAIGAIIKSLTCEDSGATCTASVTHHLALSVIGRDEDDNPIHGNRGYVGYQSQVARAISHALKAWDGSNPDGIPTMRLVLNLSLGWDSIFDARDECDGGRRAAAQAVQNVLQAARCMGAVSFAAVGNNSGGAVTSANHGPMSPARWQHTKRFDIDQCLWQCDGSEECEARVNALAPTCDYADCQDHLVTGVSGVDSADRPLATERTGSRTALVAPGALASSGDVPPVDPDWQSRRPMSGTSVSTAVASAAAATVWAYKSDWPAGVVVDTLHESAEWLPLQPEFCGESGADQCDGWSVGRISVCRTLATVTGIAPSYLGCNTVAAGTGEATPWDLVNAQWNNAVSITDWTAQEVMDELVALPVPDDCSTDWLLSEEPEQMTAAQACPQDVWPNNHLRVADVVPAPFSPPCGECLIRDDELFMQPHEVLANDPLHSPILVFADRETGTRITMNLGRVVPQFRFGERYRVANVKFEGIEEFESIQIVFPSQGPRGSHIVDTVHRVR